MQRSRSRHVKAAHDVQQGGLPAAGRTEKNDELACVEFDIHAVERHHVHLAGVIDFAQAAGLEDRGWHAHL